MAVSEKSLANLRPPWKPGQSGNPAGGRKRKTLEEEVMRLLHTSQRDGQDAPLDIMAKQIVAHIARGKDTALTRELLKRIWPEVRRHEVTADVDLASEMRVAADELAEMIAERKASDE